MTIKILKLLLIFQFVFLVIAGLDFYLNADIDFIAKVVIASLLIIDGLLYLMMIHILKFKVKSIEIFFTSFVLINIVLTFTDEVGLWDYIILLINIVILITYFIGKKVNNYR